MEPESDQIMAEMARPQSKQIMGEKEEAESNEITEEKIVSEIEHEADLSPGIILIEKEIASPINEHRMRLYNTNDNNSIPCSLKRTGKG